MTTTTEVSELNKLYEDLDATIKADLDAMYAKLKEERLDAVQNMSKAELKKFRKHDCHREIMDTIKTALPEVSPVLIEHQTLFIANAVSNKVQGLTEKGTRSATRGKQQQPVQSPAPAPGLVQQPVKAQDTSSVHPTGTLFVNIPPLIPYSREGKHCTAECKLDGCDKGEMIRCSLCFGWFHLSCVNLAKKDSDFQYWPCLTCRQMSTKLTKLENLVENLLTVQGILNDKLSSQQTILESALENSSTLSLQLTRQMELNTQLQDTLTMRLLDVEQLRRDNECLTSRLSDQRPTYAEVTGSNRIDSPEEKALLLGNDLLKRAESVKTASGVQVCVQQKNGATFKTLTQDLNNMPDTQDIKQIYIVAGRQDVESDVSIESITEDSTCLIAKAKSITPHVTVSSVLPTVGEDDGDRRSDVNQALQNVCEETNATFIDNDNNFTYRNGAIDKTAYYTDGVNLNERGLQRLMTNLSLSMPPAQERKPHQHAHQRHSGFRSASSSQHRVTSQGSRSHQARCHFCAEPGHTKLQCGHGKAVKCNKCNKVGHKAKFCTN